MSISKLAPKPDINIVKIDKNIRNSLNFTSKKYILNRIIK